MKNSRRKKWMIGIIIAIIILFVGKKIITETNITKGIAYNIAKYKLRKEYPEFGEITKDGIVHGFRERFVFPKYKNRFYTIVFYNELGNLVRVELSAYPPFIITDLSYREVTEH